MYCDTAATGLAADKWSGNFLNWATMTRMDLLRKAMYGGLRYVDDNTATVLQRAEIPDDGHAFAKTYGGSNLGKLTPYGSYLATNGGISLCNATKAAGGPPLLRVARGNGWDQWSSLPNAQCGYDEEDGAHGWRPNISAGDRLADLTVRVLVGLDDTTLHGQERLRYYANQSNWKPIGLLQEYGESSQMFFGHMTGSYNKSKSGGILRGKVADVGDVNSGTINRTTGVFTGRTGVITALNELRIRDWDYTNKNYGSSCQGGSSSGSDGITFTDGQCRDFGNPLAEMYYETLRYFAGKPGPRSEYYSSETSLALQELWNSQVDPYSYNPPCAKAFSLILSDVSPSYDADQLPGAYFGSLSDDISISDLGTTALNVQTLANIVGANENLSGQYLVEQAGSNDSNDCTPKALTGGNDLGDVQGLCPDGARMEGSYYIPGLSLYGRRNDMHGTADGDQIVTTFALAMTSGNPVIHVDVNGHDVELIPYCYNYRNNNPCSLVDFQVDTKTATVGQFRMTYDDAVRGSNFDQDAEGYLVYHVWDSDGNGQMDKLSVDSYLLWQSSGADMRLGFIMNGGPGQANDATSLAPSDWTIETAAYNGGYQVIPTATSLHPSLSKRNLWLMTSDECSCDQVNAGQTNCGGDTSGGVVCPWRWLDFDFSGSISISQPAGHLENPLWYAAKYGAFEDFNGNSVPDLQGEWDRDGDGVPNGYWNIDNPLEMELRLREAFNEILRRTSSGTAVSVLATTGEGEGAITQAYFHPEYVDGANIRRWLGYINSFFVDPYGNIREDTDNDDVLDYRNLSDCDADQDQIINLYYDDTAKQTKVRYFKDANCDGEYDVDTTGNMVNDAYTDTGITTPLTEVNPVWNGGERLWARNPDTRKILTSVNGYNGAGLSMDSVKGNFQESNANDGKFQNRLRASDSTEATNMIKWVRGHGVFSGQALAGVTDAGHSTGYRPRGVQLSGQTKVWKLGDIINSTPMVISRPAENYDLLYGDKSYYQFRSKYAARRNVVYVGANDGMIHAFNGGFYDEQSHAFCKGLDNSGHCNPSATPALGDELWAYIPTGLLPHLKWLTDPNYTHVFYVDLKPKVTDVKIFAEESDCTTNIYDPDCIHPGGWGTILIGGMRYGGKKIEYNTGSPPTANVFNPEYFAMDITDPLNPRLLWTFTDQMCNSGTCSDAVTTCTSSRWDNGNADCPAEGLGLSMSQPAVARSCTADRSTCNWFAIFGSGATNYDQNSNLTAFQQGKVFVLDLSSGTQTVGDSNGRVSTWTRDTNFWRFLSPNISAFMSDPVTVDVDLDFDVDTIYIGENCTDTASDTCSITAGARNALMRRITTNKGQSNDPASTDWAMSTLLDVEVAATTKEDARRITSPPSVAMDERTNLWVFFGTGQFLGTNDKTSPGTGAFMGVKDKCWDGSCTDSFDILNDVSNTLVCLGGGATCSGGSTLSSVTLNDYCNTSLGHCGVDNTMTCTSDADCIMGWGIFFGTMTAETTDFAGDTLTHIGEMVISKPLIVGGLVIWPTFIPSADDCATDGDSSVYAVYYKTGTAFGKFTFQEQKDAGGDATTVVGRVKSLGKGMPSSVSAQITAKGHAKGYAQSSTGAIIEIESNTPLSLKSNVIGWRGEEIP